MELDRVPEELATFKNFESAAVEVVTFLRGRLKLHLWLLTRIVDEQWIVLHTFGEGPIQAGDILDAGHSLCRQMIDGRGPNIAPDVSRVPAYANVNLPKSIGNVAAYAGAPIIMSDGKLFGTLCAYDPEPQPEELSLQRPLLLLQARLLSTVLEQEFIEEQLRRSAASAQSEALVDSLTGLVNRRLWERTIAAEEKRGARYGHPATVIMMDLDGLKKINDAKGHAEGDQLLRRAAAVLQEASRASDVVARLGGDEFGVLLLESDTTSGEIAYKRLNEKLAEAGIAASIGMAQRTSTDGLTAAWKEADMAMYRTKQLRASRST
ncbi:MAG: histidine kinase [Candidatus Velthaea sp.]